MAETDLLEGDLSSFDLPQVLRTLAARQSTGILTVQGEDDIVAVSCLNGHIVTADSLSQDQEENLGELLVAQNLVGKSDYDAIVLEHQGSGGSLGELLTAHGLISREKLLECLRLQTYRLMLQILTWRRGEFKFYGGDEVSYEKGLTPISVEEVLMRALVDLGERSGVGGEVPRLDAVYRAVPPAGRIQVLGVDGAGGEGIWITEVQQSFLERMDGLTSAFDIARALGTGRFKTLFSLHQLIQNDLIELVNVAPVRSTTAPLPVAVKDPAPAATGAVVAPAPPPAVTSPLEAAPVSAETPRENLTVAPPLELADDEDERAVATVPVTPRPWIGGALAALLLALIARALLTYPNSFLLPFPWQESHRAAVERQMRQALFHKIDDAVGVYYLMEFQYPRSLEVLVERGLLASSDLRDPAGDRLNYSADEEGYQIGVVRDGDTLDARTSSIKGDISRDQDRFPDEDVRNPIVVLD